MTVDQTLPPFLAISSRLQPAAYWPAAGGSRDWHPDRAETAATAAPEADGGRQPAPMLSPWPRIFPGL